MCQNSSIVIHEMHLTEPVPNELYQQVAAAMVSVGAVTFRVTLERPCGRQRIIMRLPQNQWLGYYKQPQAAPSLSLLASVEDELERQLLIEYDKLVNHLPSDAIPGGGTSNLYNSRP